jgi:predicted ATPase
MNGVHDVGGMHGFGPIIREANEPITHSPWEERIPLLMNAARSVPGFRLGGIRFAVESLEPVRSLASSYWARWLAGIELIVLAHGLTTREDLRERLDYFAGHPDAPATRLVRPDRSRRRFSEGARNGAGATTVSEQRAAAPPRFAVGDAVQTRQLNPVGGTRLAPVKEVAQLAATLGREFPYDLLRAVAPLDEAVLHQALRRLVAAELLYQRGLPPQATYVFKHALIQDAAYESLLRSRRQQFHQRIARVLVEQFPELTEAQPEVVAHHYTEAGLAEPAISSWLRAGERAAARSANAEAVVHLRRGLALLTALPDTTAEAAGHRARQELALQLALGPALRATQGFSTPELEQSYVRACALGRQLGETRGLFPALWGLSNFHTIRAAYQPAQELAVEALALAEAQPEGTLLVAAHRQLGGVATWQGHFRTAARHLDQAVAAYEPGQHQEHARLFGMDQGVCALAYSGYARWPLGYPDQARATSRAAVDLARRLEHPFSLGFALFYAGATHVLLRAAPATQELAETAVALARQHRQAQWLHGGAIWGGWALATQGRVAEGIARLQQGLAGWRALGSVLALPIGIGLLADAYVQGRQTKAALTAVAEALEIVEATGEGSFAAELHRLKGAALLCADPLGTANEAESCFRCAIAVAQKQEARSFELRAAVSLGRLWQRQGKREAARALLADSYHWFTEGFDTVDLQEAKALLAELEGPP